MQNNVKKTAGALIVATLIFATLLSVYLLLPKEKYELVSVQSTTGTQISISEQNKITYVNNGFEIAEYTEAVAKGQKAKISVSAKTDTVLSISVYYSSGKSDSKVFSDKIASANENAVWEWNVPSATTCDKIRVVVRSDDTYATLYIQVV